MCDEFAKENHKEYSPTKTVLLLVPTPCWNAEAKFNIYLRDVNLAFVDKLIYLGQIIIHDLKDEKDIDIERRNLAIRRNVLIRKFIKSTNKVKYRFFWSYALSYLVALSVHVSEHYFWIRSLLWIFFEKKCSVFTHGTVLEISLWIFMYVTGKKYWDLILKACLLVYKKVAKLF